MDTKWKAGIYGLLVGISSSLVIIFVCLCLFKLMLAILISDPIWHQAITIQYLVISFVLAVIGGVGFYFMLKYIGPKIGAECKNYNIKEKVPIRVNVGFIIAEIFSGLGCFYLSMWIIPIQENNLLRFMIVYLLSLYFVSNVTLYLLKKVHIRSKYLPEV